MQQLDPPGVGARDLTEALCLQLESLDIESRPLWKPMHLQPVFQGYEVIGGRVAEQLFDQGLCLPSGTALEDAQLDRIIAAVQEIAQGARTQV